MAFNFVCDRRVKDRAYPALALHQAEPYTPEWQEFVEHWPYTVPCELIEHCGEFGVEYNLYTTDENYPEKSLYLIGIGWFDFDIDYVALMDVRVVHALKENKLQAVFYYHEGDDPWRIKNRLNELFRNHSIPFDRFQFVSGTTAAENFARCHYFPDHELLFWRRNKAVPALPFHNDPRTKDFTLLSRTHKWWRATAVADLRRNDLLKNSFWSYNTEISVDQLFETNSIRVDELNLRDYLNEFVRQGPYRCDDLTADQHNDHAHLVSEHYTDSRLNIVLETHFDVDGTDGAFLTEKTFKPIKHAQPFVVVGGFKSLETLRSLGYRTFDSVINNTYDTIHDDTERWRHLFREIARIRTLDPTEFIAACENDLIHNQQLFLSNKQDRLNNLLNRLQTL